MAVAPAAAGVVNKRNKTSPMLNSKPSKLGPWFSITPRFALEAKVNEQQAQEEVYRACRW
jgi:hypothetical protein